MGRSMRQSARSAVGLAELSSLIGAHSSFGRGSPTSFGRCESTAFDSKGKSNNQC